MIGEALLVVCKSDQPHHTSLRQFYSSRRCASWHLYDPSNIVSFVGRVMHGFHVGDLFGMTTDLQITTTIIQSVAVDMNYHLGRRGSKYHAMHQTLRGLDLFASRHSIRCRPAQAHIPLYSPNPCSILVIYERIAALLKKNPLRQ